MKIQHKSPKKRRNSILTVAVLIVLAGASWLYYAHHFQKWPFVTTTAPSTKHTDTINYGKTTDDQAKNGAVIKENVANQAKTSSTDPQNQSGNSTSPNTPTVAVSITAANKTSDNLVVRTLIQSVTSTGKCSLSMAGPNGASYSASTGVQAIASSSTCQGSNVPLSSLSSGAWTITVNFQDGTTTGMATKDITL